VYSYLINAQYYYSDLKLNACVEQSHLVPVFIRQLKKLASLGESASVFLHCVFDDICGRSLGYAQVLIFFYVYLRFKTPTHLVFSSSVWSGTRVAAGGFVVARLSLAGSRTQSHIRSGFVSSLSTHLESLDSYRCHCRSLPI
jgi:hypothetical protein